MNVSFENTLNNISLSLDNERQKENTMTFRRVLPTSESVVYVSTVSTMMTTMHVTSRPYVYSYGVVCVSPELYVLVGLSPATTAVSIDE